MMATYSVTATGSMSGAATTTFTDGALPVLVEDRLAFKHFLECNLEWDYKIVQ